MPRLRAAVKREAAEKGLFDDDAYACGKVAPWVKTVAVAVAKGERVPFPPPTGMTTDADVRARIPVLAHRRAIPEVESA